MDILEQQIVDGLEARRTGLKLYIGGDNNMYTQDDIDQEEFQAMSRKKRREQPARITPQEGFQQFSEAMGGAIAGAVPGAVAGSVGAPGDIAALFKGAYDAATAEEGQRLDAFLNTVTEISEQYGSERALKLIRDTADVLPVSDQVKEGIKAGAEAGSFVGIGGAATAGGKAALRGAKEYAAGAPARVAERGRFGRFTSGMDLQGALDEMIVAGKKSDGEVDTSYRMTHQPKGPDDEDPIRLDNLTQSTTGEPAGYPDDFYTPQGQRIYAQGPSFEGDEYGIANLESYKAISRLRGKPNSTVTIYRGVPNDPNITTINKGDFVTLSKKYAEIHAASGYGRNGDEAGKVISQKVKVKDVYWDGNDVNEFGYFPQSSVVESKAVDAPNKMRRGMVKRKVSIDLIEHGESAMPGGKLTQPQAQELIKEYASRDTKIPPIEVVADEDGIMVADGSHRLEAAKLRGDKDIEVFVPKESAKFLKGKTQ